VVIGPAGPVFPAHLVTLNTAPREKGFPLSDLDGPVLATEIAFTDLLATFNVTTRARRGCARSAGEAGRRMEPVGVFPVVGKTTMGPTDWRNSTGEKWTSTRSN